MNVSLNPKRFTNDILTNIFCDKVSFMYLCCMDDLKNIKRMPSADIVKALGKRFKEYRVASQMTQVEVSEKSGVSLPTIKRFELGLTYNITMGNFIALLKAIDYADGLEEILPEMPISPYAMAKLEEKKPKRVRHGK